MALLTTLCVTGLAESNVVFAISSVLVEEESSTADVFLSLEDNPGFAAADIQFVSDLKILSIQDLGVEAIVNAESGKANWSSSKNKYTTGSILKITLAIPDDAVAGATWTISLNVTELVNAQLQDVPYTVQNGIVRVRSGAASLLAGDVNENGIVDLKDVVTLQRYLAGGWNVTIHETNADVDKDGEISAKDDVLLQRYLAGGWDVTLI